MFQIVTDLWGSLVMLLRLILNGFHSVTHSYGLSIVLLTLAVRIALLPLSIKQTKSLWDGQKLQPKIKELKEKHKKDQERMSKEIMKLYSEHKVNPLGGCLPMLLQMPILIAIFRILLNGGEVAKESFLGISNLSKSARDFLSAGTFFQNPLTALPYFILVGLSAYTTYLPQKMISTDKQAQNMQFFMNILILVISISFPAGVLIYWTTTNIFTIAQQYLTLKALNRPEKERPKEKDDRKKRSS